MRLSVLALVFATACSSGYSLSFEDELAFRELRQDFHFARTTGDFDLMRSLWTDDATLVTGDGTEFVGGDAIADYIASDPGFGGSLVVTSESRWQVAVGGDVASYGFESVTIDVGGNDPTATPLSIDGAQNPDVQIVSHTHSTGLAERLGNGRWLFQELTAGHGPLPSQLAQTGPTDPSLGDELGFRRMRETFHLANLTGDAALMRTVWADDAVFVTGGGAKFVGGDAITAFFASTPGFGRDLVLTPESSQRIAVNGDFADYAFECIAIDVGGNDPSSIVLCSADGTQNPAVEIVFHSHSIGRARRLAEGRWVFQEFNGALGPLPAAPE